MLKSNKSFINKAYDVLRNHSRLGNETDLTTQMIVSHAL